MSILFNGMGSSSGVDTGDIGHSLRVRRTSPSYLTRTFGTPTNDKKFLISAWIRVPTSSVNVLNATLLGSGGVDNLIGIGGTGAYGATVQDRLFIRGAANKDYWNPVFRDPTAWEHVIVSVDTTQATQADRAKAWLNGVEMTKGSSSLTLNEVLTCVSSGSRFLLSGSNSTYATEQYTARFVFLDGKCVQDGSAAVSDFGYQNTEINEWVTKSQSAVKAVVDAGGTNSFMLDFDDATSLTTLGYDKSSKGNNWTLNNFSLTAGTTYDHMLDVPGNSFCTINNIAGNVTGTASDGNLKLTTGTTHTRWVGTMAMSSGSWVWEGTCTTSIGNDIIGIIRTDQSVNGGDLGDSAYGYGYKQNGDKKNNTASTAYGASYTSGDVIRMEYNASTGSLTFFKNGTSQGVAFSGLTGEYYPAFGDIVNASGGTVWNLNFGQAPLHASATYHSSAGGYFRDAPTAGFKALCQRNLPDPAILNPKKHFEVKTRAGTSASGSVTGLLFQPDSVNTKVRGVAGSWVETDSVRGVTKQLFTDRTDAEQTTATWITAFNADGYSFAGQISGTGDTNASGQNYVDCLYKMGGAAVTNNNGSISSQVSANVLAGQSIVTFTSPASGVFTVGHGLAQTPELIIEKQRNSVGGWPTWFSGFGTTDYVYLNATNAKASTAGAWGSSAPNSTTFGMTTGTLVGASFTQVALCFHSVPGYSKIGSYIGNGSADGPYVECGFKPKYVLVKNATTGATNWIEHDAARETYNLAGTRLMANSANAEANDNGVDFTATGFKLRSIDGSTNTSGDTYIYYAVADVAGKYALGR